MVYTKTKYSLYTYEKTIEVDLLKCLLAIPGYKSGRMKILPSYTLSEFTHTLINNVSTDGLSHEIVSKDIFSCADLENYSKFNDREDLEKFNEINDKEKIKKIY